MIGMKELPGEFRVNGGKPTKGNYSDPQTTGGNFGIGRPVR